MKKLIGIIGTITLCYVMFFSINYFGEPQYNNLVSERLKLADSPEELIEESDLIVLAKVLPDKNNILVNSSDGQFVLFGYTETKLQIEKVFKGGGTIDDNIIITEEYYTTLAQSGTQTVWTNGNYLPAEVGETYLFFLKGYGDTERYKGMFYPIDLEYGKYVIPDEELSFFADEAVKGSIDEKADIAEKFEIRPGENISTYVQWYDVLSKEFLQ